VLRTDGLELFQIVEVRADGVQPHGVDGHLRRRIDGRSVHQNGIPRFQAGGQSPADRARAGAAHKQRRRGIKGVGKDLFHLYRAAGLVQPFHHAEVAQREDFLSLKIAGHCVNDLELELFCLFQRDRMQGIGFHCQFLESLLFLSFVDAQCIAV